MKILLWHVHGSWTTAFVQGRHTYYLPLVPGRGPEGRGRAQTWTWPENAVEIDAETARRTAFDAVIFQRPVELEHLARTWLGHRRPGFDFAAFYLEHDAPGGPVPDGRHLAADRHDLTLVHVTHFNDLMYDAGSTRTRVVEHGVIDPGYRYGGELARTAVAINEPARRGRTVGFDLLPRFKAIAPIDLFGMGAGALGGIENLPQGRLLEELPRRRVYLHPFRWTSLGLALIEAMMLGMPAVAFAVTEAAEAVPSGTGAISTNVRTLEAALARFMGDPSLARETGLAAREHALRRYGLARFLGEWDDLLKESTT